VYAETFIRDAGEDGLCVDTVALQFAKPPCVGKLVPAASLSGDMTSAGQTLYDKLIDSFSMRSYVPSEAWSGHDQFFATFGHFGGLSGTHLGEWVDKIARRAAWQNEQYLELMDTPPFDHAKAIAHEIGWSAEMSRPDVSAADFARLRQELLARGLRDEVNADREEVRKAEAEREHLEHCGTAQAAAACKVEIRYIYQVLRGHPPEEVFAQTLLGFETVSADINAGDGGFVGINFVMPEDGYIAMRDYTLQMRMLDYLHSVYPTVHITLHAGELAPGMVPPAGLRFHIRQAVELGHAERIGHGVDVMYEDDPWQLLKEMAARHVMVEINLTSNAVILGIKGDEHPFPIYREMHVPVALSTDDEGVSRIDLTHEYVMAAREYHLSYADMKELARTGMEHDFLPGASLWAIPDDFYEPVAECRGQSLGGNRPTAACKAFLEKSKKAAEQWELERRFREFEAKF
jgi:adenosine deaminase